MEFWNDQILRHIAESKSIRTLYSEAFATGFWPDFPDYQVSNLVLALAHANVTSLDVIDEYIDSNGDLVKKYLRRLFTNRVEGHHWRLSAAFLCTLIVILQFSERFSNEWLTSNGLSSDIADVVCHVISQLHDPA